MSHGTDKRHEAEALRVAKLYGEGFTHREIANLVGKKPEQIKSLILLGERLKERVNG